ncbi:hypothetical protein C7T36_00920 [Rhodococcus sp. AD45-ID]|uniref:DUF7144 domain-containing protein n=3 Tax=Nocardiaceae TaxID=85025 RepID=A0A652YYS6_NOCGL|nr:MULTISPECIES: hypothetical protein [Rhodococcus]NMD58796.1 hypothetical protein [Nocardia globerula]KJF19783.1 hypothetical protein SZ00_05081 [Rhodococcus sp. AD45]MCE4267757.1 hypothetical protein [Rhodococcus globerulus]MDV6269247.1 hypothetical protein [Rhodococcus globerulus]MDV8066595.1 hypothetical protein [Rhodococcus sp. IEGM 1366]
MTDTSSPSHAHPVRSGIATGTNFAAAALLFIVGIISLLQGISAVANDDLFVVGVNYVYEFDVTTWGWIHIALGVVGLAIAIGMMMAATWARIAAILIAALSIIANFLWLPHYPLWSILIIALDVIVIWAVATWDAED